MIEDLHRVADPQALAEELIVRQLAASQSLRHGADEVEGFYHLYSFEGLRFGALVEQALGAQVGALIGPVAVDSLYSVAKVIGHQGSQIRPFAEVSRALVHRLKEDKENQVFARWLGELRAAHQGEVELIEENIEALGREIQARQAQGNKPS